MRYRSGNLTATTTAAPLVSAQGTVVNRVLIQNQGEVTLLIGDSAGQDVEIVADGEFIIETVDGSNFDLNDIYLKSESSTCLVGWNGHRV